MRKSPGVVRPSDFDKKIKTTIHIIIGAMKSDKSLEAIRRAKRYQVLDGDDSVLFVNPEIDIRSSDGVAKSRAGNEIQCIQCKELKELEGTRSFDIAQTIILDEAQFFTDLFEHVMRHCDKKSYVIASLDGDWKQEQFGQIWSLIPYASLEKTQGFCEICRDGTLSVCTVPTQEMNGQVAVDGEKGTLYLAACLQHRTPESVKQAFRDKQQPN
jgi:thymidine kinase